MMTLQNKIDTLKAFLTKNTMVVSRERDERVREVFQALDEANLSKVQAAVNRWIHEKPYAPRQEKIARSVVANSLWISDKAQVNGNLWSAQQRIDFGF